MGDGAATLSDEEELHRLLIDGGLRKTFGLMREDLEVGLTVAYNQMVRGEHREALSTYATMILLDPMNVDHQLGLANCAAILGEHSLCLQAASAAVALAPKNPRAYYFSGRACLALGHLAEAVEDLNDAIEFGRSARDAIIVNQAEGLLRRAKHGQGRL